MAPRSGRGIIPVRIRTDPFNPNTFIYIYHKVWNVDEKVLVEGVLKTRWRCPECLRAAPWQFSKNAYYCPIHGSVDAIDITTTKDRSVVMTAIEISVRNYLEAMRGGVVSLSQIHNGIGVNVFFLKDFLQEVDADEPGETHKTHFEKLYNITIVEE